MIKFLQIFILASGLLMANASGAPNGRCLARKLQSFKVATESIKLGTEIDLLKIPSSERAPFFRELKDRNAWVDLYAKYRFMDFDKDLTSLASGRILNVEGQAAPRIFIKSEKIGLPEGPELIEAKVTVRNIDWPKLQKGGIRLLPSELKSEIKHSGISGPQMKVLKARAKDNVLFQDLIKDKEAMKKIKDSVMLGIQSEGGIYKALVKNLRLTDWNDIYTKYNIFDQLSDGPSRFTEHTPIFMNIIRGRPKVFFVPRNFTEIQGITYREFQIASSFFYRKYLRSRRRL